MQLAIIDYGMGNLRSVANAFDALGCAARITRDPRDLRQAERIVLPGVGAFGDGMQNLRQAGWIEALETEVRERGKPFLGLCLGMQLLAGLGTEHGQHAGLGWVPGTVVRIGGGDSALRVPHIGWNDVRCRTKDGLYVGCGEAQSFYFVHSYVFQPDDPRSVSGFCHYGSEFAASIELDNIYATQYHPEKSQKHGLAVLQNFLNLPR